MILLPDDFSVASFLTALEVPLVDGAIQEFFSTFSMHLIKLKLALISSSIFKSIVSLAVCLAFFPFALVKLFVLMN